MRFQAGIALHGENKIEFITHKQIQINFIDSLEQAYLDI